MQKILGSKSVMPFLSFDLRGLEGHGHLWTILTSLKRREKNNQILKLKYMSFFFKKKNNIEHKSKSKNLYLI